MADQHLMKPVVIKIEEIYVPAALRKPLDPRKLEEIAISIAAQLVQKRAEAMQHDGSSTRVSEALAHA